MGKTLNKLNKEIQEKLGVSGSEIQKTNLEEQREEKFKFYEQMASEEKMFTVQFSSCAKNGTFSAIDETGIYIIMSSEMTQEDLPYFTPRLASTLIGHTFEIKVNRVDRENGRVYVKSARKAQSQGSRLVGDIMKELNAGNKPVVWGRIKDVYNNRAFVDILDSNINGSILVGSWQATYTRYLKPLCRPGEYYEFQITGVAPRKKGAPILFYLDRQELAPNPWDLLPKDLVVEGAVVKVRCIEKPEGKTYWWGSLDIAPGIEVMCDFPRRDVKIVNGLTYKCYVRELKLTGEVAGNLLRVAPFAIAEEDSAEYARYCKNLTMTAAQMLEEENKKSEE